MSLKLVAIGNILMGDDGIAIQTARLMEKDLSQLGVEVIFGETDIDYALSQINNDDYVMILDAACFGRKPGESTRISIDHYRNEKSHLSQHGYSFIDLLKIYYPDVHGEIYGIEVNEIEYRYGLSLSLKENLSNISIKLLKKIKKNLWRGEKEWK